MQLSLRLPDPDATTQFARRLARELVPGDVLLLAGEIGAGKTHFARALIQARLGPATEVPSPTYTLVQTYQDGAFDIWHADLYRLSGPQEALELGLDEAFAAAVCLVEWPDRLGPFLPETALMLEFVVEGAGRRLDIRGGAARWAGRIPHATVPHD